MFLDLLKEVLGENKSAGDQTRFNCPFCGEVDKKFYISNRKGLWLCFKCEETGNPVSFVMKYYGVSYRECLDILETYGYDAESNSDRMYSFKQYDSELTEEERLLLFISMEGRPPEKESNGHLICPAFPTNCKPLVDNFNNPEAFPFFTYLHGRGVTLEQIELHNISYITYGEVKLLDGSTMGLTNHLLFYTMDDKRKPLYWNTRSIERNPFIKSFNGLSREGEYSKASTVFNLNNAKLTDKIVVTEGVFNALTVGDSGVATFGKQVTDAQVELIMEETKDTRIPIYLFLDTDAWNSMTSVARRIRSIDPNRAVYYVYTGTEEDANDLGPERCREYIENAMVADSFAELKMQLDNI